MPILNIHRNTPTNTIHTTTINTHINTRNIFMSALITQSTTINYIITTKNTSTNNPTTTRYTSILKNILSTTRNTLPIIKNSHNKKFPLLYNIINN